MRIGTVSGVTDAYITSINIEWLNFIEKLRQCGRHVCQAEGSRALPKGCKFKKGPAWVPAEMPNLARRNYQNIRAITSLVYDLDNKPDSEKEALIERLTDTGWNYILHATHSHMPPHAGAYRLILEISRPITVNEYKEIRLRVLKTLGCEADERAKDAPHQFFFPTLPTDTPYFFAHGGHRLLPVDAFITGEIPTLTPTPTVQLVTDRQNNRQNEPVDLVEIRNRLKKVRKQESAVLVEKMLTGESLGPLGTHDESLNRICSIMAGAVPELDWDTALHLLRPSMIATGWEDGLDHMIQEGEKKFKRARERQLAKQAKDSAINRELFGEITPQKQEDITTNGDESDWRKDLQIQQNAKTGDIRILPTVANAELILRCSPEWDGVLRYDEMRQEVVFDGCPIDPKPTAATLTSEVADWLSRSKWGIALQDNQIKARLLSVARRRPFNRLYEYLHDIKWDGKPRLDTWLIDYCSAQSTTGDGRDVSKFLALAGSKWACGAVARAIDPPCQMDSVLILEGPEGLGKSTVFRTLGGEWSSDSPININHKDSSMLAIRTWIVELAELESIRKADSTATKAFLSRLTEHFRPPFGTVIEEWPRRCVFGGTTNRTEYLPDNGANRRYLPVFCAGEINKKGLIENRDQLWAEAVSRYKDWLNRGDRTTPLWWFPYSEQWIVAEQTADRREDTGTAERIITWWHKMPQGRRPEYVTTFNIAIGVMGADEGRIGKSLQIDIGNALRDLGFEKHQKRVGKFRVWAYFPSEALKCAPQVIDGKEVLHVN